MATFFAKELGWTREEFLRRDPCEMNAYYAGLCELKGLTGRWTYRDCEIREHLPEIMAGKYRI